MLILRGKNKNSKNEEGFIYINFLDFEKKYFLVHSLHLVDLNTEVKVNKNQEGYINKNGKIELFFHDLANDNRVKIYSEKGFELCLKGIKEKEFNSLALEFSGLKSNVEVKFKPYFSFKNEEQIQLRVSFSLYQKIDKHYYIGIGALLIGIIFYGFIILFAYRRFKSFEKNFETREISFSDMDESEIEGTRLYDELLKHKID